ncbi:endonuclease/exonuclease/phosphatase family protein [Muricauda sp. SCSIO 64092]|uniref:endonuclease/exonuclease/phosphatase family protein n=1 Tax=Allomuricauda sp. SCSIO 64092 TaxID=2908842 RepID=UPI001FF26E6E|nr:endonuclease/exonuclease/phosphatase family protein [Muricauda sp. SCSIO 64092]UOY05856.1 endonuclease/exonuclease/phosphatase family protein [Muricauda sp. SCSIO 64092]
MKKKKIIIVLTMALTSLSFGQQLNVLTYNIRYDNPSDGVNGWDKRKDFMVSQLNTYRPDVFGIQEGLKHQVDYLKNNLDGYTHFGVGRDDGKKAGEYTAIFFNGGKLKLLDNGTFWLSETPNKPSKGWDAAIKRICTYGLFENRGDGNQFFVFNTHFDHVGEVARLESSRLILSKIKDLNRSRLPVILMGDFNLEPDTPGIQLISGKLEDSHQAAGTNSHGPRGTFNGFEMQKDVTRRIDYIFFDPSGFKILKSSIVNESKEGLYPSDHFPVYVELTFK